MIAKTKKFQVLITDYEFASLEWEQKILEEVNAELIAAQCKTEDDLIRMGRDVDGLLNMYFKPISRRVIDSLKKCKVISRYGVGVDTIDLSVATEHGIIVTNVPSYCIDEVSDHTIALILACARKIAFVNGLVKNGIWDHKVAKPVFRIKGKILGLIGFGKVGRKVAEKTKVFGFRILFYDPYVSIGSEKTLFARRVGLNKLLREADFVSLHLPLNKETESLLGEDELKKMKKTAFLINVARGGIIDLPAFYEALHEGRIAGAGLDVIEGTSPSVTETELFQLENVIVTPHVAWYSEESLTELQRTAAEEVATVLRGEWPRFAVNPEVKKYLKRRQMANRKR